MCIPDSHRIAIVLETIIKDFIVWKLNTKGEPEAPMFFYFGFWFSKKKRVLLLITDFEVIPSTVEEIKFHQDGPVSLVSENSLIKAKDISREHPESLVLGADIMFLDESHWKAWIRIKAVEMLKELSGESILAAATGVSLIWEEKT